MAETSVNSQITDAVALTSVAVVGQAPAQAMAVLYQMVAATVAASMQNATSAQQAGQQIGTAIVSAACARILSSGPGALPAPAPPTAELTPRQS
ncbi:MAG TPA: RebB family R body protein [Thermoanaerobaculia bacterium]|nr:RebB family R body protein [Thermoanaerobaculia bacterium]